MILLEKTTFSDLTEFEEQAQSAWEREPLHGWFEQANERFEEQLYHAAKVRDEVRTGVRPSEEKITITMYGWIEKFLSKTQRTMKQEGITVGGVTGTALFDLYLQRARFVPDTLVQVDTEERAGAYSVMHLCIRVVDLTKSIAFYQQALGYQLVRLDDHPKGEFTLAFMRDPATGFDIELTYNYGHEPYEIGNGFSHFAVYADDVRASFQRHRAMGITKNDKPYSMGEKSATSIYFITDPDGYDIEVIGPRLEWDEE
ncbi:MAG: VOC family protein [Ndongobacter sp.]|nr:VOC family protein [Ndongobacter sp.]